MIVQEVETYKGVRYLLLDDEYKNIDEVHRFLKFLDNCGKSPNTQRSYAYDLKSFYTFMHKNDIPVLNISKMPNHSAIEILSEYVIWIRENSNISKNNTINRHISSVTSFYDFLISSGEITDLDIYRSQKNSKYFKTFLYELTDRKIEINKGFVRLFDDSPEIEPLTREEYNIVLQYCKNRRDRLLLSILYESGMRVSEALGIHMSDLERIESNVINIVDREDNENGARVKRHSNGIVYLPNYVVRELIDYVTYDICNFDSEFLFLNLYRGNVGKPMNYSSVDKLFKRLSSESGIKVRPHMLRHGFATEKLECGWTLNDIKAYLRHKSITSTEIYTKYSDERKMEYMKEFLRKRAEEFNDYGYD